MFRQSPNSAYSDALMHQHQHQHHHAASFPAALSVTVPRGAAAAGGYLDGNNNVGAFSSPPSCYSSSVPSSYSYYSSLQRSISSHSLPMHLHLADVSPLGGGVGGSGFYSPSSPSTHQFPPPPPPLSSSPSFSSGELFEFTSSCPVRRVFSTGDLQGMNMNGSSPPRPVASGDGCCGQDGGGPFSQKVGRYSAEERKERIERYRVKRHQRNFNKKITYACRKTLADSRPRVKGRFARNGETDGEADEREASDNSYEYYGNGGGGGGHSELLSNGNGGDTYSAGSCYDGRRYSISNKPNGGAAGGNSSSAVSAFSGGDNGGEWWWRAPGAAAAAANDEAQERQVGAFDDDEELWATLGDMLSVNLAS